MTSGSGFISASRQTNCDSLPVAALALLTLVTWFFQVRSYQSSYPDNILLPAVRNSIVGKAKSVIWHLGPTYTIEEVIAVLTQEYEGVASSGVIFKDFYQLKQE